MCGMNAGVFHCASGVTSVLRVSSTTAQVNPDHRHHSIGNNPEMDLLWTGIENGRWTQMPRVLLLIGDSIQLMDKEPQNHEFLYWVTPDWGNSTDSQTMVMDDHGGRHSGG